MADPFVAEIRIFPFNFPPRGWAFCDGQILSLSQNTALFSLLGTNYGGDGKSTFALPNLQGSAAMHTTQFTGNSPFGSFDLGQTGGEEAITLLPTEMPSHTHSLNAVSDSGLLDSPVGQVPAQMHIYSTNSPTATMSPNAITVAGGSQPHNNMQPYLTLNFCIAMQGVYPPRS